jgi:hypothetical protein
MKRNDAISREDVTILILLEDLVESETSFSDPNVELALYEKLSDRALKSARAKGFFKIDQLEKARKAKRKMLVHKLNETVRLKNSYVRMIKLEVANGYGHEQSVLLNHKVVKELKNKLALSRAELEQLDNKKFRQ